MTKLPETDNDILRRAVLPHRITMLEEAANLTGKDRPQEYGEPYFNLSDTAALFTAYLCGKYAGITVDQKQFNLTAEDIAWLNVLQKMSRSFSGKVKQDTYIDAAAYSAIAGECAIKEAEE